MWNPTRIIDLLIAIVAALAAGLFAALVKIVKERLPYQHIGGSRYRALRGKWKGMVTPREGAENLPPPFEITFEFCPGLCRRVRATSSFKSQAEGRADVRNIYRGGFQTPNYLILRYHNKERRVMGFGGVLFYFSDDARRLEGKIVGYSSHRGINFYSTLSLTKVE